MGYSATASEHIQRTVSFVRNIAAGIKRATHLIAGQGPTPSNTISAPI